MNLTLTDLHRRDHRKAIQFALEGMHCEAYFNHALPMKLYGLRFFYSELNQATQAIAAYANRVKGMLSVELNAGQMVEDVRLAVEGTVNVAHFGRLGGIVFTPDEVLAALKDKLINV